MDRLPRIVKSGLFFPSETEMLSKSATITQGGEIGIPDSHTTANMLMTQMKKEEIIKQWMKEYDFHYADLQIVINPNQHFHPYYVKIEGEMNPGEPVETRPSAKDIFPRTEFVDANYKIEGNFVASASAGFHPEQVFNSNFGARIEGEAKITFNYHPMIAKVNSGTADSTFYWAFEKAEGKEPIGGLDIKLIIQRLRKVKDMHIVWKVSVTFHRPWHRDYTAETQSSSPPTTKLYFKRSQIK
jgi:hypothetical protein